MSKGRGLTSYNGGPNRKGRERPRALFCPQLLTKHIISSTVRAIDLEQQSALALYSQAAMPRPWRTLTSAKACHLRTHTGLPMGPR